MPRQLYNFKSSLFNVCIRLIAARKLGHWSSSGERHNLFYRIEPLVLLDSVAVRLIFLPFGPIGCVSQLFVNIFIASSSASVVTGGMVIVSSLDHNYCPDYMLETLLRRTSLRP